MNVYGPPSCWFDAFAGHLASHPSPALSEARAIWTVLVEARIDPAVALGFFHHESACGTQGRAATTRSWGNIRWREVYATAWPHPIADVDGFCGYPTWQLGAVHFADHLRGRDGTNAYAGVSAVEEIVPRWAPTPTNDPVAYSRAVEMFARELSVELGRPAVNKPRILHVAGHLRTAQITVKGLCPPIANDATVSALRGMTGTGGEQDFTSNMATLQADLMNATGLLEARAIDCVYHRDAYVDWKPQLVLAHHIHRDGMNRAMFAVPDNKFLFHSAAANAESLRLLARILGGYTKATGIPVSQDSVTLRMRQLYNWCYIDEDSEALIPEYGNGNLDTVALFDAGRVAVMARFIVDCVLEHFDLVVPTSPSASTPAPPLPGATPAPRTLADAVGDLERVTREIRTLVP